MHAKEKEQACILVVDDEPDLSEMLAFEFTMRGFSARTAFDGRKALELLRTNAFDAVLSDVCMPSMSGLELLDILKSENPDGPAVILMSAFSDISVELACDCGAEAFVSKPFRLSDIVATVDRQLMSRRQRWAIPPAIPSAHHAILPAQNPATHPHFRLGRGGACIEGLGQRLQLGQSLDFDIVLTGAPIQHLAGTGTVRWIHAGDGPAAPQACGIEFEYIDTDVLAPFLDWLDSQSLRAYIPAYESVG